MKNLQNKTVFITGGLSGIGKACAIAAAKEGANLAIADRETATNIATMDELKELQPNAIFIECNVVVFAQVKAAIEKTVSTFGTLDVALNNAGIGGKPSKIGDMEEIDWLKVIGIDLTGIFNCMKHELAQMAKQQKGVIINISSISGEVGFARSAHYVAAKHGIIGLSQTAALEYATEGIRVNVICPGFIETPLLNKLDLNNCPDLKQHILDAHPMHRLGKPDEIACGFIFLASDDSSFVTGTTLNIDGGYLAQ
ncbi:MAG: SDR family oxidoreductase [Paludibacteraceae bacterium]|nr:SDR family oxidoreductase [Paludibacteraceae bacterium]